ncbi:MAG: hypothetical protein ACSHYA_02480 [Opitutaceae bacterium]
MANAKGPTAEVGIVCYIWNPLVFDSALLALYLSVLACIECLELMIESFVSVSAFSAWSLGN